MLPTHTFYFEQLYPLQDLALALIQQQDTGFYLTGGTAVSRVYLHHRFSDDHFINTPCQAALIARKTFLPTN